LKRLLWNREAKERFEAFLDRFDPKDTIVHFHSFRRILSTSVVSVAAKRGFPRVMTLHDFGIMCPNTAYYHYPDKKPCTYKPLGVRCLAKQCTREGWPMKGAMVARQLMISKITNVPHLIRDYICVTRFSQALMVPHLPKTINAELVLYPVDVEKHPPIDAARNTEFMFIGRMETEKDPVLLAKAAKRLGVPVTFVGDGPQKDAILAANPDAKMLGWLRPEGVREAMEKARCLVLTSRWYETAGLVVIDALASGVPAIVPHTCAAQEFVKDGETGLIFHSGDDEDLARKMALLLDDEKVAQMGHQAYEEFWARPETMDTHVSDLLQVYGRIIGDHKTAGP
jgi:glycosyltransferase involved in cell wall biosynthesis